MSISSGHRMNTPRRAISAALTNELTTTERIGTYVYREGLQNQSYSYSTAVGLFTSILAMVMVLGSNAICKRLGQEGIW